MRARIGAAMGQYWGGIVQVIDVIAAISALGTIGGLPALLSVVTKCVRHAKSWLQALTSLTVATKGQHQVAPPGIRFAPECCPASVPGPPAQLQGCTTILGSCQLNIR